MSASLSTDATATGSVGTQPQPVFDEIPTVRKVPGTNIEIRAEAQNNSVFAYPARMLVTGQMITGSPGLPNRIVKNITPSQAAAMWGPASQIAAMVADFVRANPYTQVDAIALADASSGAVKATQTLTFTGAATGAAQISLVVDGISVQFGADVGDTPTVMATNAVAAIGAVGNIPVTAASAAGVVTATARHAGTIGNMVPILLDWRQPQPLPAGVGCTISAGVAGSGDPDLMPVLSTISAQWYTDIIQPFYDVDGELAAYLTNAYNAMVRRDAHAYGAQTGAMGTLINAAGSLNSRYRSGFAVPPGAPQAPWHYAAVLGAIGSYYLTSDPARQLRGLAMPGIIAPPEAAQWTEDQREALLEAGWSTFLPMADGTVVVERVVTENKTDPKTGAADTAWYDIMAPKTMSRIRYDWRNYVAQLYPRSKLANDGTIAATYASAVVTPSVLKGSWATRCTVYEQSGWIEDSATTAQASYWVRDTDPGGNGDPDRANGNITVKRIGNLMSEDDVLTFSQ